MRTIRGTFAALVCVGLTLSAIPAKAEIMRVDGHFPAISDEAANLRSIAVADFSGEDGPHLSLLVSDRLREVRIDGRPWLNVLSGGFGRDAEASLGGNVRTSIDENVITLQRSVCVAKDANGGCAQSADQPVECLRVTVSVRPDLRLLRGNGALVWQWSQANSTNLEYCPDFDDQPDVDPEIERMLGEFARTIRYQLAPAHEGRNVRVLEGRGDLPRPLRNSYRNAMRQVERDATAACNGFAALLPQAPAHTQLMFNNALCAERNGQYDQAASVYQQLANGRGAVREGRDGLARIEQYRRANAQIVTRGG